MIVTLVKVRIMYIKYNNGVQKYCCQVIILMSGVMGGGSSKSDPQFIHSTQLTMILLYQICTQLCFKAVLIDIDYQRR